MTRNDFFKQKLKSTWIDLLFSCAVQKQENKSEFLHPKIGQPVSVAMYFWMGLMHITSHVE